MRGLALLIGALLLAFAGQSQFANGGLVRDALADTATAVRRLGPRRTTLEDVFLKGAADV